MTAAMNPWRPDASPRQSRRVGKSLEELGELSAVLARISIQGIDGVDPASGKTNRVRVGEEIADVRAQLSLLEDEFDLDCREIDAREFKKRAQMDEWESLL